EKHDREEKMPIYAREGVRHAWLVDPIARTLEVYTLREDGYWGKPVTYSGVETVCAVPFDAIGLELSALWT
ncbi:MAG: Uma2 family endonuclease, partial [Byssovorax sp.]